MNKLLKPLCIARGPAGLVAAFIVLMLVNGPAWSQTTSKVGSQIKLKFTAYFAN